MDRDIRNVLEKELGLTQQNLIARGWGAISRSSFIPIIIAQKVVNAGFWYAGRAWALDQGKTEKQAIIEADAIVRQTQSGGGLKDLAKVQRGGEVQRSLVMFYTYFSVLYNRLYEIAMVRGMKNPRNIAVRVLVLIVLPVLVEKEIQKLLDEYLYGKEPPDDDDDGIAKMAIDSLLFLVNTIPGVRDIASGVLTDYGYQFTPIQGTLETMVRALQSVGDIFDEDEELSESQINAIIDSAGAAAKMPVRQVRKIIQAITED